MNHTGDASPIESVLEARVDSSVEDSIQNSPNHTSSELVVPTEAHQIQNWRVKYSVHPRNGRCLLLEQADCS